MSEEEARRLRQTEDDIRDLLHIKDDIKDIKDDLTTLKSHDEDFTRAMYESCDAKTKEIDLKVKDGVNTALIPVNEKADNNRKALYGLFILFVGSLGWLTLQDMKITDDRLAEEGRIHEKINKHVMKSSRSKGNTEATLKLILDEIKYIRTKIDKS